MTYLAGIGSGAYGAVIGGIVYYFVTRMTKFDAEALRAVVLLLGGAIVLYFLQKFASTDDSKPVILPSYAIGLFFGWVMPTLLKWDADRKR